VKHKWMTNRLTVPEITPPDRARVEPHFNQGKAVRLAYAT